MGIRDRGTSAVAALSLLAALSACGSGGGAVAPGCSDGGERQAVQPGDAEPVLVLGDELMVPTVVYADGAVAIPESTEASMDAPKSPLAAMAAPLFVPGYHGPQPDAYVAGWLSPCELADVLDAAERLVDPEVDYGDPTITDAHDTSITYHPDGGDEARTISLYAFVTTDSDFWEAGLSADQRSNRRDLADLWLGVLDRTHILEDIPIDRVHVVTYNGSPRDEDVTWPLPPFTQVVPGRCATLTGQDALDLVEYLHGGGVLTADRSHGVVDVVAVAPGMPACG